MSWSGSLSEKRVFEDAYTYDDVLIVPLKSDILPTEVRTTTRLTNRIELNIPIVSAAMDTVTESHLAIALAQQGGIGIIHKNMSIEKQVVVDKDQQLKGLITVKDITKKIKYPLAAKDQHGRLRVGAAVGATGDFMERISELVRMKVDAVAVDTAHGHSARVIAAVK